MEKIIQNNYSELIILMVFIIIIGIIIILIPLFKRNNSKEYLGLKKIDKNIDKEQLTKDIFTVYKKMEVAKSKFDFDTLKELLTDNLYKEEEQKLQELKKNKQKLVLTNIKLQELKILSITKKEQLELINIYLHVSKYDYIINNKKEVIRGTDESEYQVEYKISLEKNNIKYFKINNIECTGKWIKNK